MFRYTWPGQKEKYVCSFHATQLHGISQAMGFELQFIAILEDVPCHANVKEEKDAKEGN